MAVAANALTTLATVKTELGISASTDDAYIERLINAASDRIEQYCSRSFYKQTAKVEKVAGYGSPYLRVSKAPILSIGSIAFDGLALDASIYEIHDADAGLIFAIGGWIWTVAEWQVITGTPMIGSERKLYSVTYDCGYVTPSQGGTQTLPYDLEDACIALVVGRYRARGRDPNIKAESLSKWSASYGAGGDAGMPESVRSVLDRYAKVAMA